MAAQIISTLLQTVHAAQSRWAAEKARAEHDASAARSNTQLMKDQGLLY